MPFRELNALTQYDDVTITSLSSSSGSLPSKHVQMSPLVVGLLSLFHNIPLPQRFPNCVVRGTLGGTWGSGRGPGDYCFLVEIREKMCIFLYMCSRLLCNNYAVILANGSEETAWRYKKIYLKSEMDCYYFSFAIWNSITKDYPNKYVSAIRHNVLCSGEWKRHNYYYKYLY